MPFSIFRSIAFTFWLALYSDWMTYPYKVDMWQYTETGRVPGISVNVDINLFFPWESDEDSPKYRKCRGDHRSPLQKVF